MSGTKTFRESVLRRWARSLLREVGAIGGWFRTTGLIRQDPLWLAVTVAVAGAVRCYYLAQPMRYDEAYTFLNFVNSGPSSLFHYPLPNNHVLHTLLVRVSVGLFGAHPVAIRLPAFLAGLLSVPLTFSLARLLTRSEKSGFTAAMLMSVFPYLVLYDTMARGYSLLVLLNLCLAVLAVWLALHPSATACFLISLVAALGLLDMPSFLFPAAGVLLWTLVMLVERGHGLRRALRLVLIPCVLMTVLLTGLFYTPVLIATGGTGPIASNRFIEGLPWQDFLARLPMHAASVADHFTRDIPPPLVIGLLALAAIGLYTAARKRDWPALTLLPALLIAGAVVLLLKHAIPFERSWIYLLPFVFILADRGLGVLLRCSDTCLKVVTLCLALTAAVVIMNNNIVSSYPDTGHFPEAPALVAALSEQMSPADRIVVKCPADAPMEFYLWYMDVPRKRGPARRGGPPREFAVVKPSSYSLADVTERDARMLLKIGDAELYVADMDESPEVF